MGLRPGFRIIANGGDITEVIADRLVSLRLTDEAGEDSDVVELVLADHLSPIALPEAGAELEVFLGYDLAYTRMGLFVVDELELSGWPSSMTIRARAAIYKESTSGKIDIHTQKTRSWPVGTTLGGLVQSIASDHGLKPAVAPSLAGIALPHTDQTRESDLHLLQRLAKRYDAVVKPAGGTLALTKLGEGKTASGKDLPPVRVAAAQCSAFRCTIAKRYRAGTVKAFWQDTNAASREEAKFGDGEPIRELRQIFPTQSAAEEAARSEWNRRARGEKQLSLTLPGDPSVVAEAPLIASGFRDGVDGDWIISRVEHSLHSGTGYQMTIEAGTKPKA